MAHLTTHPVKLNIQLPPQMNFKLEKLVNATGHSKSFLASEAIENYIEVQLKQIKAIKATVRKANSKKAKFIDHKKVSSWLNSWGTDKETDAPK